MSLFSLPELVAILALLFLLSAFFSGSETALMAVNRYRLRHLARQGKYSARCAQALLEKPDRLIGLILLGNNLVNILITQLATYLGYVYFQEVGVAVATGLLTVAILVFAELAPKTLAALHAERVAYPAAVVYRPLLVAAYPLVWLINQFANGLLRALGMPREEARDALTQEEFRSVVHESSGLISRERRKMLLGILDLEKIMVEDVMVPRGEIVGIDLDNWSEALDQLRNPTYTRVLVYEGGLDNVRGVLHWRKLLPHILNEDLLPEHIRETMREPYFIPKGTSLHQQLCNFQKRRHRVGLVIDEYGDIQGLVTLEHILEEIVGAFTVDSATQDPGTYQNMPDGSVIVDASVHVRELNEMLDDGHFHVDGPRTLNGLILEHLEDIPAPGTSMLIDDYPVEVVKTDETSVRTVRIYARRQDAAEDTDGEDA